MSEHLSVAIKQKARMLGFDLVGIARAEPSLFQKEYREWIDRGYAGEMHYLMRHLERRLDPQQLLPDARSIVVVAMNYYSDPAEGSGTPITDPDRAIFARYARGDDYHDVMTARLRALWQWVQTQAGAHAEGRVYVDTGPLLEREVAQKAGLGWFGKNTMLINTRRGSYFLLGEIVTNLVLEPDQPARGGCGTCRRCIDACPTGAIVEPYVLDARRCISYLTIELKGEIPEEYHAAIAASGNRIFGCDICQEVCPFNLRRSVPATEPAFRAREVTDRPRLTDLLAMDEETFRQRFRGSPVKRARWHGLRRNVLAALRGRTLQATSEEEAPPPGEQRSAGPQAEVRRAC